MGLSFRRWTFLAMVVLAVWLGSCTASPTTDSLSSDSLSSEDAASESSLPNETTIANAPDPTAGRPVLEGTAVVELIVNGSPIVMTIDGEHAPVTAGNFVDLINRGVYDGLVFHRVVRDPQPFVVQGGDPQSKDPNFPVQQLGTGGYIDPETNVRRFIPLEIQPAGAEDPIYSKTFEEARISEAPELAHTRGAVAMARSQEPDSASSQFYITLADLPFLDGNYAVFGYVTEGMDVVDQIQQGDVIQSAQVVEGLDNLKTDS